ncbi:tRNA (adenosine(37)-N6)-threonylcarbamoyltransferase complex dimerization subunit type 1 TsaB [Thalassobius sp. S69A]|uniref:tRNA (adenosine(37)-N6)-threonylcarbamoyltransferase complex dimerization subunit type 1 TsaB n=1 Tax=unclassified Thalassovita TaxID=2619711 RepID=UPI000C0F6DBC|nr:tRNA (adenosine(37)-N6)-threonylcarbamoyltransferase complex dimerization subunit type 1 TsaB [Paracoccaceae bacterium]MBT27055.1 tRNA (adenosine(37)-N6)-threonylcarbamoyltransferase complex dimerization subunit type 1 TsaB [Paracoccaceae bacterium]
MSDPLILAFDTSAAHCAAALLCGDRVVTACAEEMKRGQAERLMPLLQETLTQAGHRWTDLSAIGVGVGPGNFTGIRISVSAARGLALGLDVPAIGVSSFEAIALSSSDLPAVPGPRGQMYVLRGAPQLLPPEALTAAVALPPAPADLAVAIARCAAARLALGTQVPAPAPLYVKPADAAPSKDAPPVILDDT